MGLNISPLQRDQDPPQSKITKFLRSLVVVSGIATGGVTAACIPDDISMVQKLPPNPTNVAGITVTDRHINLMTAKLAALLVLGGSFASWRQSLADDEHKWIKKFSNNRNPD